jgi:hypothetical protein
MSEDSPISEKLLQMMHNMGLVGPQNARAIAELGSLLKTSFNEVARILAGHEKDAYVASFTDPEGNRRYYLTGKGILKACSVFT